MKNLFIEFDLAGAEWVVVAYLSQDPNMLEVVHSGKSPHIVTGALISGAPEELVERDHKLVGINTNPVLIEQLRRQIAWPPRTFLPRSMSIRQAGKKSNHGLNYDMRYRRFALENEMTEADAEPIVILYRTKAYPRIFTHWHPAVRKEMKDNNRSLTNCFGRKVTLRDEWGQDLFNAAYSFKPQSTVFDCVRIGMKRTFRDESAPFEPLRLGAQVHDSFMMRYPIPQTREEWQNLAIAVLRISRDYMRPALTYSDTTFYLNCDVKIGWSWGRMHGFPVEEDLDRLVETMQAKFSYVVQEEQRLTHPAQAVDQVDSGQSSELDDWPSQHTSDQPSQTHSLNSY